MPHRIAVLIGTRPEAVKLAPVIAALRQSPELEPIVISTGQHRQMIDQVIELFGIKVDVELNSMEPNQSLATLTARMIERIDGALATTAPAFVLVQGDTSTVLCGALASFYRKIPIGHVEAGLRTGDIRSPFPEEANRRLTTPLVTIHFAPTEAARRSLLNEGVAETSIELTGNTVVDALQFEMKRQEAPGVAGRIAADLDELLGVDWHGRPMALVTGHRRENFGDGFREICHGLAELARLRPDLLIVYPVHLNPNVADAVHGALQGVSNIRLIPPQPYAQFVALARASRLILTDSGGVQEEAPTLGKPVLVMRDSTERPEGVAAGTAKLIGADRRRIVEETLRLLERPMSNEQPAGLIENPFGDGRASRRIVTRLKRELQIHEA
jgi:UDP-N-acetylglucosamine 2-epimerase (non-hydrolysing)